MNDATGRQAMDKAGAATRETRDPTGETNETRDRTGETNESRDRTGETNETRDGSRETEVREALRVVIDPEIGMDVVTLGLIRAVDFHEDFTEVTMILTTPFCPYGGSMVQQVKNAAQDVVANEVKVTMGEEQWSPDMMEGGDWAEWGLV